MAPWELLLLGLMALTTTLLVVVVCSLRATLDHVAGEISGILGDGASPY